MNGMASECSSGCESGWTYYLEKSFPSPNPSNKKNGFNVKRSGFCDENTGKQKVGDDDDDDVEEEEEEDLSMVSDASSGPPHFYEDSGYFNDDNNNQYYHEYMVPQGTKLKKKGGKRHRNKEQQRRHLQAHEDKLPSFLDDTASSPLINYSMNNFVHTNNQAPMGFSATHFEGGSKFQDHYGFLQSSSPSANQLQNNQWF